SAAVAPFLGCRYLCSAGVDMSNAMASGQEAKSARNRPVPTVAKPAGDGPKKVLDDVGTSGGKTGGGSSAPARTGGGGSSSGTAAGAGKGAAAAGGASAGSAGAGAAAAGPAAAAVIGAQVVKGAATAGPKAGSAVGGQAEAHA